MTKAIYLSDLHFEHKTWLSELTFQKDELRSFQNRLEEVVPNYTNHEVLARAEQFQNKLMVHNEIVDTYLHDIRAHEQELVDFAKSHPISVDHVHFTDHSALREKIETQREMFTNFKKDFFRFLMETM
jgi:hypothetical protein